MYFIHQTKILIIILFHGIYWVSEKWVNSPQIAGTNYSGVLIVINSRPYRWQASDLSNWNWQIYMLTDGNVFYRPNVNSYGGWYRINVNGVGINT